MLAMEVQILIKDFSIPEGSEKQPRRCLIVGLGPFDGAYDLMGGGGSPVVDSTLISTGEAPRKTIRSVNFKEFFVTLTESMVFILTIGFSNWKIILGLIIGGIPAAPLGALLTKKLPTKTIVIQVGCINILLQMRTLYSI